MTAETRQRIDKWLFYARVVKSRSLAAKLVQAGRLRVNREKIEQPSHPVKIGDTLTITLDRKILVYRVLAPGARRGPAEEARELYDDLTPPLSSQKEQPSALPPIREQGAGRPTKKERRALERWREEDGE